MDTPTNLTLTFRPKYGLTQLLRAALSVYIKMLYYNIGAETELEVNSTSRRFVLNITSERSWHPQETDKAGNWFQFIRYLCEGKVVVTWLPTGTTAAI